jgi:hypothetical protein
MTTTFETAKVCDKVFSPLFGWGVIERIDTSDRHPIFVRFAHDNSVSSFTVEGYYRVDLPRQSLFWGEVSIEAPPKPLPTRLFNGVEILDISFKPIPRMFAYIPAPTHPDLCVRIYYCDNRANEHLIGNRLCYPDTEIGMQAAIMHAKAMLGINPPK